MGLAWSRSGGGGRLRRRGPGGGWEIRPGECVCGKSSLPDTGSLVVGWAAIFTAHLREFNWSLQARDSCQRGCGEQWSGAPGFRFSHIIKPHFKWFELMTLIQTDKGGKWMLDQAFHLLCLTFPVTLSAGNSPWSRAQPEQSCLSAPPARPWRRRPVPHIGRWCRLTGRVKEDAVSPSESTLGSRGFLVPGSGLPQQRCLSSRRFL